MNFTLPRLVATLAAIPVFAAQPATNTPPAPAERALANYFRHETARVAERCLADIKSLDDWTARREEYRRQLAEMLGLWPMPQRTPLQPVITGQLEQEDFIVEKLHFQASPQLYVTANLYRPKQLTNPAPAILYACGHSRVMTNGVSCGNKTGYQHHGAWFARHGFVCLTIDTVQYGEILGVHRGTSAENMWWWISRGYTPAGLETWFGLRALDYLCSRPEVNPERIGMTGRSGGGAYTWFVAALDDRVKVACPIAGITDLQNNIVDGGLEGHCDCMFFLNLYGWDYGQLAALLAPRPLLLGNSDKDRLFPLDGVLRIHEHVRRIYELHGAKDKLGLLITEGPHEDTQDLQVPVFRWFDRFLNGEKRFIETAAKKFFDPLALKVLPEIPADERNTKIHESFVPSGRTLTPEEARQQKPALLAKLREKTFRGWPTEEVPLNPQPVFSVARDGLQFRAWDFASQPEVTLRLYLLEAAGAKSSAPVLLDVLDAKRWGEWLGAVRCSFDAELKDELRGTTNLPPLAPQALERMKGELASRAGALAFVAPRGVGLTAWGGNEKQRTQIRRRFMLLGQTLDGMRVWDIRRAVQAVHFLREGDAATLELRAAGTMAVNARFAALFEPGVRKLDLRDLPASPAAGPDYLNVLRHFDGLSAAF